MGYRDIILCLMCLILPFLVHGDVIILEDGREIEGIIEESDDEGIFINTGLSEVFFSHDQIQEIERVPPEKELLQRGKIAYQGRNYREAYRYISEAREKTPDLEEIDELYSHYKDSYVSWGKEEAQRELRSIEQLINNEEYSEALQDLKKLHEKFDDIEEIQESVNDKIVAIHLERSQNAIERYNFSRALYHAQEARKVLPYDNEIYQLKLPLMRRTSQRASDIEKYLKEMVNYDPDNYEYVYNLGRHYYDREKYEHFIDVFDNFFERHDINQYEEARELYAYSHFSVGERKKENQPDEALQHYKKALEYNPQLTRSLLHIGEIYYHLDDYIEARQYLEKASETMESNPRVFYLLGNILTQKREFNKAREHLSRSINLSEHQRKDRLHYDSLITLADLNFTAGFREEAIRNSEEAVEVNPDRFRAYYWLGKSLTATGDLEKGEEKLQQALRRRPTHEPTLLALAENMMETQNYTGARNMLLQLLEENPDNENYYFKLGEVYYQQGQYIAAETQYQRALERKKDFMEAYLRLIEVYRMRRDPQEAVDIAYKALEIEPENSRIFLNLGILYHTTLEEYEKALDYYEKYYESGGTDPQVQSWIQECEAQLRRAAR